MKNNKGITLIALVVTIIVLLILAGVSIAMLSGQNGILNRASQATWQSKLGDAESTVALTVSNYLTDYYAIKYTGANSDFGLVKETATEESATRAALTRAQTELGGADVFTVTATPDTGAITSILIVYKNNSKSYSVKGTVSGSNINWGKMVEGATGATGE